MSKYATNIHPNRIFSWIESEGEFVKFLNRFEPKSKILEMAPTFKILVKVEFDSFLKETLKNTGIHCRYKPGKIIINYLR